jgi:hypothetical protein
MPCATASEAVMISILMKLTQHRNDSILRGANCRHWLTVTSALVCVLFASGTYFGDLHLPWQLAFPIHNHDQFFEGLAITEIDYAKSYSRLSGGCTINLDAPLYHFNMFTNR